ncbi:MAG: hypothetical protein CL609_15975 [Anaerolineaceae bacterium]|nr:hypothetical protein [Anaerolineaceae bacterium]
MKKVSIVGLIVLMLLISACASAKSVADENFYMESPAAAPMEQAAGMDFAMEESMRDSFEYEELATDSGVNPAAVDRIVIRNADLSIVVDEPADAMTSIGRMAERMGGFIVTSNMWKARNYNGVEVPEGNITVRVPAELLNQALDEIKALTNNTTQDVLNENISGQDVTEQYTNLNARLRNSEDAEEQLRTILDNATDTEAVLEVFNRLTEVREEIEVIKGQIKYYEESAALSAISVRIQAHEAVNPISVAGWKPSVTISKALQSLVNAFQAIVDGLIWIILFILPILLVLAIPVVIFFLIIRGLVRRNRRKKGLPQNVDVEK